MLGTVVLHLERQRLTWPDDDFLDLVMLTVRDRFVGTSRTVADKPGRNGDQYPHEPASTIAGVGSTKPFEKCWWVMFEYIKNNNDGSVPEPMSQPHYSLAITGQFLLNEQDATLLGV